MEEKYVPKGIPSVTYVRILPGSASKDGVSQTDLLVENNTITVAETGQPSTKHDVAQVYHYILPLSISPILLLNIYV